MDTLPFKCPYCEKELVLPEDGWHYSCPHCKRNIDIKSQFAYLRGLDAFHEGQNIMIGISPRKRRLDDPSVKEAIALFMEAYSSIQVAFQSSGLALHQKSLGVEMMSSMATEFMKLNMVSPLEMSYWKSVMVELTAQKECDQLKSQLADPGGGIMFLKRFRMHIRRKQLVKALADLDRKLHMLERQIEFIETPRARNENWKP